MLSVHFINVGYGDSIYLCAQGSGGDGFHMLIDTGGGDPGHIRESPNRIGCADYLRGIGVGRLDALLLTHLHLDHVGGLAELAKAVRIDRLLTGYLPPPDAPPPGEAPAGASPEAESLWRAMAVYMEGLCLLRRQGTLFERLDTGREERLAGAVTGVYTVGDGALQRRQAQILDGFFARPARSEAALRELDGFINDLSIALLLRCGKARVLLPGDACTGYWQGIPAPACDVLKLAHHGYTDCVTPELAARFSPRVVVISVSDSRTDRPSVQAAAAFDAVHPRPEILCTDAAEIPGYCARREQRALVLECGEDGAIKRRAVPFWERREAACVRM